MFLLMHNQFWLICSSYPFFVLFVVVVVLFFVFWGVRQPLYAKRKLHVSHLTNGVAWIIVSHLQCHNKQCLKLVKPAVWIHFHKYHNLHEKESTNNCYSEIDCVTLFGVARATQRRFRFKSSTKDRLAVRVVNDRVCMALSPDVVP